MYIYTEEPHAMLWLSIYGVNLTYNVVTVHVYIYKNHMQSILPGSLF